MKLIKLTILMLSVMSLSSDYAMQPYLPKVHPLSRVSHIFNIESFIKETINKNNNPYETAKHIMNYLASFQYISLQDMYDFREYALKELQQKYFNFAEELIDIQWNIFKLRY